jgi:hypothetical protein
VKPPRCSVWSARRRRTWRGGPGARNRIARPQGSRGGDWGTNFIDSPPGKGTSPTAQLPLDDQATGSESLLLADARPQRLVTEIHGRSSGADAGSIPAATRRFSTVGTGRFELPTRAPQSGLRGCARGSIGTSRPRGHGLQRRARGNLHTLPGAACCLSQLASRSRCRAGGGTPTTSARKVRRAHFSAAPGRAPRSRRRPRALRPG